MKTYNDNRNKKSKSHKRLVLRIEELEKMGEDRSSDHKLIKDLENTVNELTLMVARLMDKGVGSLV